MKDPKKAAEAVRKIQEIQNKIKNHLSRISQIENEKHTKLRYYDQQIKSEKDQISQHDRAIEQLKRDI